MMDLKVSQSTSSRDWVRDWVRVQGPWFRLMCVGVAMK